MLAYTGIETVSNMAEEAQRPGRAGAADRQPRADRGDRHLYAGISIIAMSALPVTQNAAGHYSTALGTTYKDDPVLGIVSALHLHGTTLTAARYYIGALAATILIIATNAGMIGISRLSWSLAEHRQLPGDLLPAPPALPDPLVHDRLLLGDRDRPDHPGQDRLPRQPLQLRRDALVHDRARRDRRAAAQATRCATGPTGRRGTSTGAASRCR